VATAPPETSHMAAGFFSLQSMAKQNKTKQNKKQNKTPSNENLIKVSHCLPWLTL